MASEFKNVRTIALTAVLIALTVVGNGVTKIPVGMGLEIRFGFIFMSAIAYLFGPVVAFASGFITSTLAFLLFPSGYGYNVLFDLNAGLAGFIYAVFLYRRNYKSEYFIVWIVAAKIAVNLLCNIVINTALLRGYIGSFADLVSITRVFKNIALLPGEIVVMMIVIKYIAEAAKKYKFVKYVGDGKKKEKGAAS
jgi:ECF transporter S component (folate family)